MPTLSIITPSYGYARFLPDLLRSVAALGVDHEHLVHDGASTDGTVALLEEAAVADPGLDWVSEPDAGQNDAVNRGLRRARGEFVNWINADDAYVPGAIERAVALLQARPELDAVFGGMDVFDEHGVVRRRYVPGPWSWRRYLYAGDYVPTETIVFRRSLLQRAPQLDEGAGDAADYDFYLRLLHGARVERIAAAMILYRHHDAAKTTSNPWEGQARARAVRARWARNGRDRAVMDAIDGAKRAILPRISAWPEPY